MKRYISCIFLLASLQLSNHCFADSSTTTDIVPIIERSDVDNALDWLIDELELEQHGYDNYQIYDTKISPDGHYAVINISNGKPGETPGPFYRFAVIYPKVQRIFFPAMKKMRSHNLGYPYIAAKFSTHTDLLAIAFGYRSIVGKLVSLPDADVLVSKDLEVYEVNEIEQELSALLE